MIDESRNPNAAARGATPARKMKATQNPMFGWTARTRSLTSRAPTPGWSSSGSRAMA
jgi:hypothetical protein